jgi:hypothetical protein
MAVAQPACTPLPPPTGTTVSVNPGQAGQLRSIVNNAASGTTVLLNDGFYDMSSGSSTRLIFGTPGVTLRSASGNRGAVILDGGYVTDELVSIYASNVTIADITLKRAYDHPIHISGLSGSPIQGVVIHNVRIVDPGQQAIKINSNGNGWADDGVIQCSSIELTSTGRTHIRNSCYTGGIDAHAAQGWVVRRNRIEGFWCASGLSEHGIHFWNVSRDTLVEQNVIVNCARGIGFGLGSSGGSRSYPDDPYPGVANKQHIDGAIRNNFIAASDSNLFSSQYGFDTGVGLEQAAGAWVLHNSVASTQSPASSSIEWRWGSTFAEVANNLTTDRLLARNGAQATLQGNISTAQTNWFADFGAGDLHLAPPGSAAEDSGTSLPAGWADKDFDHQTRDAQVDVGADEAVDILFEDDFESGGLDKWVVAF